MPRHAVQGGNGKDIQPHAMWPTMMTMMASRAMGARAGVERAKYSPTHRWRRGKTANQVAIVQIMSAVA